MGFSVGIIGLPNVGKSTLFKALTKREVDIADYPFTTIHPNIGIVAIPDERLDKMAEVVKPKKITPTAIEFVDIAGLVKGAHKGEGLGNQFLAQIRSCDAIIEVIKTFGQSPTPTKDMEIIENELKMKDLNSKETENLLSKKPIIYLLNTGEKTEPHLPKVNHIIMNLKDEEGISELSEEEVKELALNPQLDQLIICCYNILDLITFFTITGGEELRAWTVPKGVTVPVAGGRVHTDFQEKFIRAEVINWKNLVEDKGWIRAREKGQIQTVGKEYLVKDGDVIEFKI